MGVVTLLLTDIEGSSRLWEEEPEGMAAALARHDEIIAAAVQGRHGVLVKQRGEGDSAFAVFGRAKDAMQAAVDAQQLLAMDEGPTGTSLRVRMAIHTGEAELRDGDYYGASVNRVARLRELAHGGQVLCSQAAAEMGGDGLPPGLELMDLGEHRLRDLARPMRVFQLCHESLPRTFAPLPSLEAYATNLPAQATAFVGRREELGSTLAALEQSRLVTLTGVGGVGKTRLALQVAAEALPRYADGVWLVELGGLNDPDAVDEALAAALGVARQPGETVIETVLSYLRNKRTMLVVDNCEHLLSATARTVEAVLSSAPHVQVLATSREPLSVRGERIFGVPSLPVPEPDTDPAVLGHVPAVELFVDRARAARSEFTLSDENTGAVALLCRRLDGIPLALELAAARVRSMAPAEIVDRLEHRFRLLTGGARGVVNRHQTLRSAIDWSYDLLDTEERALLGRLAVCVGGFTLDAAEVIGAGEGIDPIEVDDILGRLIDKSLLVVSSQTGPTRYRMLETIRAYALERLAETAEVAHARDRHATYYADLATQLSFGLKGPHEPESLQRLDEELDNLRAAVAWSLDGDDPAPALTIVTRLALQGIPLEASVATWAAAIAQTPRADQDVRYPAALGFLAWATWREGRSEAAQDLIRDVYARLDSAATEPHVVCRALSGTTAVDASMGLDPTDRAWQWVDAARRAGDIYEEALAMNMVAVGPMIRGEQTAEHASAALALGNATGSPSAISFCSFTYAMTLLNEDPGRAEALLNNALTCAKRAGNNLAYVVALGVRGGLLHQSGQYERAAHAYLESVHQAYTYGHRSQQAATMWLVSACLAALERGEEAAVLMGWVQTVLGTPGQGLGQGTGPGGIPNYYGNLAELQALAVTLGDQRYDELIARGAEMTDDEALRYADELMETTTGPPVAGVARVETEVHANEFRREGDVWVLRFGAKVVRLRDAKGLHYLAALLAHPGREVHVADLTGAGVASAAGTGPALDTTAASAYKRRIEELQADQDEATQWSDTERAARARAEVEALTAELSAAYGLGGRPRTSADPVERMRKAVTNRIRDALDRISDAHDSLGRHLRNAVRTGTYCSYLPERPTTWVTE